MDTFGERLKYLRNKHNLTQEQFALKFFLNKSSVSRYEKNLQFPEFDTLLKISSFFNISLDFILCQIDEERYLIDKPIELTESIEKLMSSKQLVLNTEALSASEKIIMQNSCSSGIKTIEEIRSSSIKTNSTKNSN